MARNSHRTYEIRCPVYGFIKLDDWERKIISQPAFQRLRRIRQLSWTDYVYPGAMHTRFEHSLGVMHMATMLYDSVVDRSGEILEKELGYNNDGLRRHRKLVRLAALLHDVGHSPFSHAAEELFPFRDDAPNERYQHEHYSAEIVRHEFSDVIKNHSLNRNYGFSADDVANLLEGSVDAREALFWRDLISSQLDADRMDYLLRDSLHSGVDYGKYDWHRLVHTVTAIPSTEDGGTRLGVTEGGWHAAEGLIIARYFMFTQVYFHKTRVILDYHLKQALANMLPNGTFPKPVGHELNDYLEWDDWCVLGKLKNGEGGEDGERLRKRDPYREITSTLETPDEKELDKLASWEKTLGNLIATKITAEKSWYKLGVTDIPVLAEGPEKCVKVLSELSSVVSNIKTVQQIRLYARPSDVEKARNLIGQARGDQNER